MLFESQSRKRKDQRNKKINNLEEEKNVEGHVNNKTFAKWES